jgi:hypothetical protein
MDQASPASRRTAMFRRGSHCVRLGVDEKMGSYCAWGVEKVHRRDPMAARKPTRRGGLARAARGDARRPVSRALTSRRTNIAASLDGDPRAWLRDHHEGRLGYQTGRGPRAVVVLYAVAAGQVLMRLPDYNDIVHYAPGAQVTLEVAGAVTSTGDQGTVTVTGTARLVGREQMSIDSDAVFVEPWPAGVSTSIIGLPIDDVRLSQPPDRVR